MPELKSPPDIAFVRQQIERLEQELSVWKATEKNLLAIKAGAPAMGFAGMFTNMSPFDAICSFLKRVGNPQPRAIIITAVIEGGASLGAHKEKSINQSISTNVGLKKLKEKNGLVGLPSWPDDKFHGS
ncbi:MAG TPA: hypothetical protein VGK24_05860 [Candidatus Angelobacter sp.]|jgi:hypothetical protein